MRTFLHGFWATSVVMLACAGLPACGDVVTVTSTGGGTGGTGGTTETTGGGGTGGAGGCQMGQPPQPSADWCSRLAMGPKGTHSAAVGLAAGHMQVRFFGPVATYGDADQALASALAKEEGFTGKDLSAYVSALPGVVCTRSAGDVALGPGGVKSMGDVAIVTPGTAAVELPKGTKAVLLDLRGLPWVDGLRNAITSAVSPALAAPVAGLSARVRSHQGMVDEVFSEMNAYTDKVATVPLDDIPATGTEDLPIAVLTEASMPADAVEIALELRAAKRAWIVGEGLRVEVAEARWWGVTDTGLAIRYRDLVTKDSLRLPDAIDADVPSDHPECFASDILSKGPVPDMPTGTNSRPAIVKMSPFGLQQAPGDPLGDARAALMIAHGAARAFFPYFDTVGDNIDARLEEVLSQLPATPSRPETRDALRRFGNALVDGHNFVVDYKSAVKGYFPVMIEDVGGKPVVRRSGDMAVSPGDTITKIGGVPADQWYSKELPLSAGATPGYQFDLATREFIDMIGPTDFEILSAGGATKTVTIQPHKAEDYLAVVAPSGRTAGFLADLGAPDLYYINMDSSILATIDKFGAALTEAKPAKGLVIDMRGYPGVDHYEVAQRLATGNFSSPIFRVPHRTGPDQLKIDESSIPLSPLDNPSFHGPIALIVGHHTVSAAENFSTMLVDAKRVHVVGRNSAGTNGNITGVQLPGSFAFTFTGMEVRHADAQKSVFHGVGIAPDKDTALSAQDFAAGKDPELLEAIAWLSMQ